MKRLNQNSDVLGMLYRLFYGKPIKEEVTGLPVRMTCTRLRKFRETKQSMEFEPPTNSLTVVEPAETESAFAKQVDKTQEKNEEKTPEKTQQEEHYLQLLDKQRRLHEKAKRLAQETDMTMQGFEHFSSAALQQVAKDPKMPVNTLKWLAAHYDVAVRRALALNTELTADIMLVLARDADRDVKLILLDNPRLPLNEIVRFSQSADITLAGKAQARLQSL